jgi:hypothetical protein
MRAAGLPVAVDFIPYWGNISSGHTMVHLVVKNALPRRITNKNLPLNTTGIIDVSMDFNPTERDFKPDDLPKGLYVQYNKTEPKVYRCTYSAQPEMEQILASSDKNEIVPSFNKLNIKDVSDVFIETSNSRIKISHQFLKHQVAYLCVFSIDGWKPVALTKIDKSGIAVFNKIGENIVYLPAVYENKEFIPVENPFYIDSTSAEIHVIPDKVRKLSIRVIRKYHLFAYTANHPLKLKGGRFEGSNYPDFTNSQLLYEIDYFPFYMNQKIIHTDKTYRYVRYISPKGSGGNIAEITFYGMNNSDTILLKGRVMGARGNLGHEPIKAFDQNMDTYYESVISDGWVGLDLGQQKRITKIGFCPRNDTNCIIPGNTYELFYWDGQWISLGMQKATKDFLTFDNVPTGSLFWLKCRNGGKEERIFTYKNGMQIWW